MSLKRFKQGDTVTVVTPWDKFKKLWDRHLWDEMRREHIFQRGGKYIVELLDKRLVITHSFLQPRTGVDRGYKLDVNSKDTRKHLAITRKVLLEFIKPKTE